MKLNNWKSWLSAGLILGGVGVAFFDGGTQETSTTLVVAGFTFLSVIMTFINGSKK